VSRKPACGTLWFIIMKPIINKFYNYDNSVVSTIRTIVLFGKNVSTYKFALASTLLNLRPKNQITYEDLRDDFIGALLSHYQKNPHQYQSGENSLTRAFDKYKLDGNWSELVKIAEKNIYNNVFDAFHNVGGGQIKKEHILFENLPHEKKLVLTDNINEILEQHNLIDLLKNENESRWMIVEEAWKNNISPNFLVYNRATAEFESVSPTERTNLRSAVSILLPYQHGCCFYCKRKVNIYSNSDDSDFPDVDHFIAHSYFKRPELSNINPDAIWNLVIACKECNRGSRGKFTSIPQISYQKEIINRNVLFTEEHRHSPKNSILLSLNAQNHTEVEKKMLLLFSNFNVIEGWKPLIIYSNE
jgi:5-methylcytosine-specific restriction endonuclease McrA